MDVTQSDLRRWAAKMISSSVIFLTVTTVVIMLRLYVRRCMLKSVGLDDWLLLLTYLCFIPFAGLVLAAGVMDLHADTFLETIELKGKLTLAGQTIYLVCSIFLKLALASFFLRIVIKPWQQRWIIQISITVFVLYTTAYTFVYLFKCGWPTWQSAILLDHCAVSNQALLATSYVAAILNALTDWLMAISPLFVITTTLNTLPRAAKVSVYCLTLLGLTGSIVSVARIPMIKTLSEIGAPDYVENLVTISVLSLVEVGIGIVALSLAALRPLMKLVLHDFQAPRQAREWDISAPIQDLEQVQSPSCATISGFGTHVMREKSPSHFIAPS